MATATRTTTAARFRRKTSGCVPTGNGRAEGSQPTPPSGSGRKQSKSCRKGGRSRSADAVAPGPSREQKDRHGFISMMDAFTGHGGGRRQPADTPGCPGGLSRMKSTLVAVAAAALIALVGCNGGTTGGPGAEKDKKSKVERAEDSV